MPPTILPVWNGSLTFGETCFLEIDPAADSPLDAARIPDSVRLVVISMRTPGDLMWMPHAAERASATLVRVIANFSGAQRRVAICPHADGFPSDVPSTLAFLRTQQAAGVELVVEPAALLTPALIKTASDHLARVREGLLFHPQLCAIIVSNFTWDHTGLATRTVLEAGIAPMNQIQALATGLPNQVQVFVVN